MTCHCVSRHVKRCRLAQGESVPHMCQVRVTPHVSLFVCRQSQGLSVQLDSISFGILATAYGEEQEEERVDRLLRRARELPGGLGSKAVCSVSAL